MNIIAGRDYYFKSVKTGMDDEITDDHLWQGNVSETIFDSYHSWSQLDGLTVSVTSVKAVKNITGCQQLAKVFIKDEGVEYWFTARGDELYALKQDNPVSNGCNCELSLLMVRGCQCGGQ
tara:strand:+ start:138 stop:497 length:360 start_codon:yes stop_codon:yes gene_type:complete